MNSGIVKFKIVGILTSTEFQTCKAYVEKMHKNIPTKFDKPDIRAMLDVAWEEFLTKMRRNEGGKWWRLHSPVAVFVDDNFLGNEHDLIKLLMGSYRIHIFKDFEKLGIDELINFIQKSERTHVYFMISVDKNVIGTLLFQLYTDLVPLTCDHFLKLVTHRKPGYKCKLMHRIVKPSWIQFGGSVSRKTRIPCENYIIPHDRRGVLSMCHNGKHKDNSYQFYVTLNPAPWMDCKYVGFGQLLHGADVLQVLESIQTLYESPNVQIVIAECGEYSFKPSDSESFKEAYDKYLSCKLAPIKEYIMAGEDYIEKTQIGFQYPPDILDPRDVPSEVSTDYTGSIQSAATLGSILN